MISREEQEKYLKSSSSYWVQQALLWSFTSSELQNLIKDFEHTYNKERSKLLKKYKAKLSQDCYIKGNEMEKHFIKMMFHCFEWGEELNMNKEVIKKLKTYYKLHFTDMLEAKKYTAFDINTIPIKEVIWMYCTIPNSLRRNIRCMFPDHKDSSASFKIYEDTNSFCCYGCWRKWNSVNFLSEMEWITTTEAFLKLKNLFNNYT